MTIFKQYTASKIATKARGLERELESYPSHEAIANAEFEQIVKFAKWNGFSISNIVTLALRGIEAASKFPDWATNLTHGFLESDYDH